MQVSFLISVSTPRANARALLDSIAATLPAGLEHEILLADSRSKLPAATTVSPHPARTAALNATSVNARGEFLCLLDENVSLEPGWLGPLLAAFSAVAHAGVVASVLVSPNRREVLHAGMVFSDDGLPTPSREPLPSLQSRGPFLEFPAASTTCCLVRRSWFRCRGGFNERFHADLADTDLCLRAHEDGLINLIASRSLVRTEAPPTARNWSAARDFLNCWSLRAKSLQRDWAHDEARRRASADARRYFEKLPHRLRLGSQSLHRHHRRALELARRAEHEKTKPIRIGVDIGRMLPGGANGGVKPFIFSFLAEMGRIRADTFSFVVFADASLSNELAPILRAGDYHATNNGGRVSLFRRAVETEWQRIGDSFLAHELTQHLSIDALWAPFSVSPYMSTTLPCVSLLIDLLHRDLPGALPPEEVNFRHETFQRVVAEATYIQTISRHAIRRLHAHYNVPASRCFYTYLPVHTRLPEPTSEPSLPAGVVTGRFFFYPANFWPHKNHEALFHAYLRYQQDQRDSSWPLVLTGAPDARLNELMAMRDQLGLREHVHFLGHLADRSFASMWVAAGALVFPSLHEGFGIPLLEAMRFGVPILSSDAASLPEIGGEACLFVDARNANNFAAALARIATDERLRTQLRERGRARLEEFSLRLEAGRLAHFLECAARRQTP